MFTNATSLGNDFCGAFALVDLVLLTSSLVLLICSKERLRRVMREALEREEGVEHSKELLHRFVKATTR